MCRFGSLCFGSLCVGSLFFSSFLVFGLFAGRCLIWSFFRFFGLVSLASFCSFLGSFGGFSCFGSFGSFGSFGFFVGFSRSTRNHKSRFRRRIGGKLSTGLIEPAFGFVIKNDFQPFFVFKNDPVAVTTYFTANYW
ncbi:MAG TPA: hypothetical protein DCG57_10470 [Candidatus Riflebacteria bacterium]|nr:hypothetical protein [Candidatus Riflebacteria bacterium]